MTGPHLWVSKLNESQFCVFVEGKGTYTVWDANDTSKPVRTQRCASEQKGGQCFVEGGLLFQVSESRKEIIVTEESSGDHVISFQLFTPLGSFYDWWLVVVGATRMIVWRIGGSGGGSESFTAGCCQSIDLGTGHFRAALSDHHVNVLFVPIRTRGADSKAQNHLEMIDLEESFSKGMKVMVGKPVSLPPGDCMNLLCGDPLCAVYYEIGGCLKLCLVTVIAITSTEMEFEVYNTTNLNKPCLRISPQRFVSQVKMHVWFCNQQVTGILMWSSEVQKHAPHWPTGWTRRYVITDAETDTLLAVVNYGLTVGQDKLFFFH
ncbi:hypothetical protein Pelo_18665 [Pelomyxa schiedti]|nr:hypothetical protein Pelo_18665 [Pelomyxa schiedti]